VIKGRKTFNFFMNLLNPCNPNYVTIDGHMVSVWLGRRILLKSKEASLTAKKYTLIAEDYKTVARELGILPNQLQAVCWMAWKRKHRILYNPQLSLWVE